jgi:phosphohistidine swiveling domain-containing protein
MIQKLFSSQVTFKILAALFSEPKKIWSTAEIIKATDKNQTNIQRELEKLQKLELVIKESKGKQNFFQINQESDFYPPLADLFAKHQAGQKKFYLLNEEGGSCLLSVDYMLKGFRSDYGIRHGVMREIPEIIAIYKNDYGKYYFEEKVIENEAKYLLSKLLDDASFVNKLIYPETIEQGEEAQKILTQLKKKNFKVTKKEMLALIDKFNEIFYIQVGLNHNAAYDLKDQLYSNYLNDYLQKKIKTSKLNLSYATEKLLAPEKLTYTQIMKMELLKLAISGGQGEKIKKIWQDWQWLNYSYTGPGLEWDYIKSSFAELQAQSKSELRQELYNLQNNENLVRTEKNKIFQQLKIDDKHQNFIKALSLLAYLKIYRKDTAFMIFYINYKILDKLIPELKRTEALYLLVNELKQFLAGGQLPTKKELKNRRLACAYFYGEDHLYVGAETDQILKGKISETNEDKSHLKILEGTTACLGRTGDWVSGTVKVINSANDMSKMEKGDILVSYATTPEILPAMKKAAAIVTDHGGITCHAAIVSRELNLPCLIATKYATKIFKDGDKVVVCPRHRYIRFQ